MGRGNDGRPTLFTYTIPVDDGAAPNPFRGLCTLAICKPGIRRAAKKGDWVAGLGSKKAPSGDLSKRLVYAMHVDESVPFDEYDERAAAEWPDRVPDISSADLTRPLGDCIYYDCSGTSPRQRSSVHGLANLKTDWRGKNVLISRDFYYFGSKAIKLPKELFPICHQGQGHKSHRNDSHLERFVRWLRNLLYRPGEMYGWPDYVVDWDEKNACGGCLARKSDGERDRPC
jgi:hypothetical protein